MKQAILLFRLARVVVQVRQFNWTGSSYHREARHLLKSMLGVHYTAFPSRILLKMQWYMAELLYVGHRISALSGHTLSAKEKESFMLCGALGALCDWLVDDTPLESVELIKNKRPQQSAEAPATLENFYTLCYHRFFSLQTESTQERTRQFYEQMYEVQVQSKRQFSNQISAEEVTQICREKCGFSFLFARSILLEPLTPQEEKAWFEFGAYIQYCNDAQDLHKDLQKGIQTSASVQSSLEEIRTLLENQRLIAISELQKCAWEKSRLEDFLFSAHVMHLAILAKLSAFEKLCAGNFTLEHFKKIPAQTVREAISPAKLLRYVISHLLKKPPQYSLT